MGKPRGKATDPSIHSKGSVTLLLQLGREAHVMPPLETRTDSPGETPKYPKIHVSNGEETSGSRTNSRSSLKLMSIKSVMPSNHLILCCPLLLLPSIFLSIRGFSNESVLHIRWPKYWSSSFNISPSNELHVTKTAKLMLPCMLTDSVHAKGSLSSLFSSFPGC